MFPSGFSCVKLSEWDTMLSILLHRVVGCFDHFLVSFRLPLNFHILRSILPSLSIPSTALVKERGGVIDMSIISTVKMEQRTANYSHLYHKTSNDFIAPLIRIRRPGIIVFIHCHKRQTFAANHAERNEKDR